MHIELRHFGPVQMTYKDGKQNTMFNDFSLLGKFNTLFRGIFLQFYRLLCPVVSSINDRQHVVNQSFPLKMTESFILKYLVFTTVSRMKLSAFTSV
jgi:hypothetical protein